MTEESLLLVKSKAEETRSLFDEDDLILYSQDAFSCKVVNKDE